MFNFNKMDPKQLKERLKSARDFVKNKQFAEALEVCEEILRHDQKNYNALVFRGAALVGLQQIVEALDSYRQATQADPAQILAWQGICNVYEKHAASVKSPDKSELVGCYEKLFGLISAEKSFETGVKLSETYLTASEYDKALSTCEHLMLLDAWKTADEKTKLSIWKTVSIALPLASQKADTDLLERACRAVIGSTDSDQREKSRCWDQLIRSAAKNLEDVDRIWRLCLESIEQTDELVFPLELMCRIYLDTVFTRPESFEVNVAIEKLQSVAPGSAWLQVLEGHRFFVKGETNAAESVLCKALKTINDSVAGLFYEAESLVGLHKVEEARATIDKAFSLLSGGVRFFGQREKIEESLKFCRARALLEHSTRNRWEEALELCQELCTSNPDRVEFKLCLGRILLNLADFDKAERVMDEVLQLPVTAEALLFRGIYFFLQGKLDESMQRFEEVIEAKANCAMGHFYLGVIHFRRLQSNDSSREDDTEAETKDEELQTTCLKHLLQAARLDPYFSNTFVYLGHFYRHILHDSGKATRCYQKAFELDNDNQEAGAGLVDCLLASEEKESALRILTAITDPGKSNSPKWAWMRLGLYQMRYGDATDAIRSFQTAIKQDPKDVQCWECLGDAFVNRGSYSSAVKVFTKVTELAPNDLYSYYQVAALKLKLGLYAEAVDQYKWILERSPDYIPALQGLSTAYLEQCRRDLKQLLYGRAIDRCQDAIKHLASAAKMRPEISCLWKQLGDACTMLHMVPSQLLRINVAAELLKSGSTSAEATELLTKKEILPLGARCYGMALKLQPDMSSLWHDLGVNYYAQTKVVEKVMSKVMAIKSLQALRKSVTLDPSNHQHWTALGVVAASKELSDPGLAQHCFIKSAEVEPNNVVAWTNLGTLYLINNHVKLAHEAFKVAQSLEPSYASSWIGQAFIAESLGDHDAMDLFRHTTELADNPESCIGYAHWVCLTLKDSSKMSSKWYKYAIEHLNAVTAAGDAMSKYTDSVPDNVIAWNMFSLLLERQNLNRSALKGIERAVQLLATSGVAEGTSVALGVRENYARLLCKNGKYEEAVKIYEMLPSEKSFDVACGLGLALLKAGQPDKSIEMYEKALLLTSQPSEQSLVRVALGMATLMTKDIEGTKTHLFQSIQSSPPSVDGLKALLFIAYLERDPALMMAVLQRIQQTVTANSLPPDLTVLTTYIRLRLVSAKAAALDLVKSVHLRPFLAENWTELAKFILMTQPDGHEMARSCSRVAVAGDTSHRLDALLCLSLACLPGASSVNRDAFRAAQKAVHLRPDALSSWCLLLAASHLENAIKALAGQPNPELPAFSISVAERLFAQIESELRIGQMHKGMLQLLRKWCARQYALVLLSANRLEPAFKFIEQAAWYYDDDPIFCGLTAYFSRDQSLKRIVQEQPSTILYQILQAWLLNNGSLADAHNCYKLWLQESSSSRTTALGTDIRSCVSKCLFEMHAQAGNEGELRELLSFAKKAKDQELIRMYEQRTSSA